MAKRLTITSDEPDIKIQLKRSSHGRKSGQSKLDKRKKADLGKISVITFAIMNIVAVVSLRGLPAEAVYGLSSIFFYVFAAAFSDPCIACRC